MLHVENAYLHFGSVLFFLSTVDAYLVLSNAVCEDCGIYQQAPVGKRCSTCYSHVSLSEIRVPLKQLATNNFAYIKRKTHVGSKIPIFRQSQIIPCWLHPQCTSPSNQTVDSCEILHQGNYW